MSVYDILPCNVHPPHTHTLTQSCSFQHSHAQRVVHDHIRVSHLFVGDYDSYCHLRCPPVVSLCVVCVCVVYVWVWSGCGCVCDYCATCWIRFSEGRVLYCESIGLVSYCTTIIVSAALIDAKTRLLPYLAQDLKQLIPTIAFQR